jgi:deazaflavin-dependent oxidoreductase (nitroreductase family)
MSNKSREEGRSGDRRLMRLVRQADRKLATPPMRALVESGLAPRAFVLLETTGRRTGQVRHTPVGNGLDGDTFWLVAQRGLQADYVRNLQAQPRVRVKVGSMWRSGTAHVLPDDDPEARIRAIVDRQGGRIRRSDAHLLERLIEFYETTPVTVRIDLDPFGQDAASQRVTLAGKLRAYGAVTSRGGANKTDLLRHVVRRPALLAAIFGYEAAALVSGKLSPRLKELAGIKTAGMIGCPF